MRVMVFGSFDKLHDGHRSLFAQGRAHGDVFVVVARDESIRNIKKREPRSSEGERVAAVAAEPDVHKAVLGHHNDFFLVIEEHKPDVLLLGYDQTTYSEEEIVTELARRGLSATVLRAKPFKEKEFKSSFIP